MHAFIHQKAFKGFVFPSFIKPPPVIPIMLTLLAFALPKMLDANPVYEGPPWRDFKLVAENVTITVGQSASKVEGDYTFHSEWVGRSEDDYFNSGRSPKWRRILSWLGFQPPYSKHEKGNWTAFTFPIVLPQHQLPREAMTATKPSANLGSRTLETTIEGEGPLSDAKSDALPSVPDGWTYRWFQSSCNSKTHFRARLHLSYIQPHLPGNIAAYMPILPKKFNKRHYQIIFQAAKGVQLAPMEQYDPIGSANDTRVAIHPGKNQLLAMRAILAASRN